ncbi:MAG TPA: hypothetical protein PKD09_09285 [Aggregatilinea sp.]|uniref:hypothetical protein n=1 Tax=Aggregatilinea sp. TaxID=2806333 RepID=UPI002BCC5CFB|nr:hypothetical protein [Aggregatilinea sp.]HML21829.1 hypothetical protein [Aggregatilinea sp.]
MTITSITNSGQDSESRAPQQERLRDEPIRLHFTRTPAGWQTRTGRDMPAVRERRKQLAPMLENDWFRQGGVVVVERHWTEISETDGSTRYCHENVKGRLLGLSRNGRVWVLVHRYVRLKFPKKGVPAEMQDCWELRLVDPDDIEPLGYGLKEPPPIPADIWRLKSDTMPFDKPKGIK